MHGFLALESLHSWLHAAGSTNQNCAYCRVHACCMCAFPKIADGLQPECWLGKASIQSGLTSSGWWKSLFGSVLVHGIRILQTCCFPCAWFKLYLSDMSLQCIMSSAVGTMEVLGSLYLTTWSSESVTEQLAVHLDNEWCMMTTHGVKCLKGQMFMSKMKAPINN